MEQTLTQSDSPHEACGFDKSVHCQYNICMLTQKLYKNGNSVAVTIPKVHLKELGLRDGSPVEVDIQNKDWVLRPKKTVKHYSEKTREGRDLS